MTYFLIYESLWKLLQKFKDKFKIFSNYESKSWTIFVLNYNLELIKRKLL